MTVNEAIRALTEARDKVGGDAPLLMADGLHVVSLLDGHHPGYIAGEGPPCVYVCDSPQPGSDEEMMEADARKALRRYGVNPDGMTRSQVYERLEAEGGCDLESVVGAVLGGMDYPVRLPGTSR